MTRHNRAELPVEILRHVLEGQRLQPEFGRIRAGQQIELRPPQWRGRRAGQPVGRWQSRILAGSRRCPRLVQDIHRRCVGPLEILHTTSVVSSASASSAVTTSRSMRAAVDTCVPAANAPAASSESAGRCGSQLGACLERMVATVSSSADRASRVSRSAADGGSDGRRRACTAPMSP